MRLKGSTTIAVAVVAMVSLIVIVSVGVVVLASVTSLVRSSLEAVRREGERFNEVLEVTVVNDSGRLALLINNTGDIEVHVTHVVVHNVTAERILVKPVSVYVLPCSSKLASTDLPYPSKGVELRIVVVSSRGRGWLKVVRG